MCVCARPKSSCKGFVDGAVTTCVEAQPYIIKSANAPTTVIRSSNNARLVGVMGLEEVYRHRL